MKLFVVLNPSRNLAILAFLGTGVGVAIACSIRNFSYAVQNSGLLLMAVDFILTYIYSSISDVPEQELFLQKVKAIGKVFGGAATLVVVYNVSLPALENQAMADSRNRD